MCQTLSKQLENEGFVGTVLEFSLFSEHFYF